MSVVGIGTDVVSLSRFAVSLERTPTLRGRLFTEAEARLPTESLAARFAAKEALAKALGSPGGLRWHDCEVVADASGTPAYALAGTVAALAATLGVARTHVSLSHDGDVALAFCVLES